MATKQQAEAMEEQAKAMGEQSETMRRQALIELLAARINASGALLSASAGAMGNHLASTRWGRFNISLYEESVRHYRDLLELANVAKKTAALTCRADTRYTVRRMGTTLSGGQGSRPRSQATRKSTHSARAFRRSGISCRTS